MIPQTVETELSMEQIEPIENPLLDTSEKNAEEKWHSLLSLQTELFLPYEICFLLQSQIWQDATNILDVGCGNGSYISHISKFFPDKFYTAIDRSPELILIAKKECTAHNLHFEQKALETFHPEKEFDLILMRLVVQHLNDFSSVLSQAKRLLKPGGKLLIIEPDLNKYHNQPAMHLFDQMLNDIEVQSAQKNTNRHRLSSLGMIATATSEWAIAQDEVTTVPFVGPFERSKLLDLYHLWIDVLDLSQILPATLNYVREEIKNWSREPSAYSQIGIRFLMLENKYGKH